MNITSIITKIKSFFIRDNINANLVIPIDKKINLTIGDEKIQASISINNNSIVIDSPMNIVIKSNLFAVKTDFGVHLNPSSLNCDEMKRVFMNHQDVIEHHVEPISNKLPYKLKVKRFKKFLKGR